MCVLLVDWLVIAGCIGIHLALESQRRVLPIGPWELLAGSLMGALGAIAVSSVVGVIGGMLYWLRTGCSVSRHSGVERSARDILAKSAVIACTIVAGLMILWAVNEIRRGP